MLEVDSSDLDTFTEAINTAVTETAKEILGKKTSMKKPWVTPEVPDLCDKRRNHKKLKRGCTEGAQKYRQADKDVKKSMRRAKEEWISATRSRTTLA